MTILYFYTTCDTIRTDLYSQDYDKQPSFFHQVEQGHGKRSMYTNPALAIFYALKNMQ